MWFLCGSQGFLLPYDMFAFRGIVTVFVIQDSCTLLMSEKSENQRPRFQNDVLLADVEQQAVALQLHKCQNKKLPYDFNIANGNYRSV